MAYDGPLVIGDKVGVWITGMLGDFVCEVVETCKLHRYHLRVLQPGNNMMTGTIIKGDDFIIRTKL